MLAVVAFSGGDAEAAPTADFGFAVSAGGADFDVSFGVAVDGQGNVYTTGVSLARRTSTLAPVPLTSPAAARRTCS